MVGTARLDPAVRAYFASVPGWRPGNSPGLITGIEPLWSGLTTFPVAASAGGLMTPSFF